MFFRWYNKSEDYKNKVTSPTSNPDTLMNIISQKATNKGFTLIELLVTMSIAAILLSIAVPSFKTMFKNNRVSTGTNEFVAALVLARSEALKRNNNVSICTTNDQQTCGGTSDFARGWIVFVDCNRDGAIDNAGVCDGEPEQIIKVHGELNQLSLIPAVAKQFFTYTFAGRSATATFNVTEKGKTVIEKEIIINLTGRVRVQ